MYHLVARITLPQGPLQHPLFRRLWLGLILSRVGDQLTLVSLLWFMFELTGSGAALGAVILCFSLPGLVSSPLVGRWLGHTAPHRLIVGDNLLRAVVIAAIPLLYWAGALAPWVVYGLAGLAGLLAPGTEVGIRVLLPTIVQDQDLEPANAMLSSSDQLGYLFGPAIAGLLIGQVGAPPLLLFDAVSFLAMALLIGTGARQKAKGRRHNLPVSTSEPSIPADARATPPVPSDKPNEPIPHLTHPLPVQSGARLLTGDHPEAARPSSAVGHPPSPTTGLLQSLRLIWGLKGCLTLIALSCCFNFTYGPLEPALPLYSEQALGAGVTGYGLLWSAFGAGALLGLLATPRLGRGRRPGLVCAAITALWGLLLAPLALLSSLPLALGCFALAGAIWAPYIPIEVSTLQRLAPPALRGQVFGVHAAALITMAPLGVLCGGLLLEVLPAATVIGLSALACLAAGLVGLCAPALRRL